MSVLEDLVVDHILTSAHVEEVEASYADVISGAAIAPPTGDVGDIESEFDVAADAATLVDRDPDVSDEAPTEDGETK